MASRGDNEGGSNDDEGDGIHDTVGGISDNEEGDALGKPTATTAPRARLIRRVQNAAGVIENKKVFHCAYSSSAVSLNLV